MVEVVDIGIVYVRGMIADRRRDETCIHILGGDWPQMSQAVAVTPRPRLQPVQVHEIQPLWAYLSCVTELLEPLEPYRPPVSLVQPHGRSSAENI